MSGSQADDEGPRKRPAARRAGAKAEPSAQKKQGAKPVAGAPAVDVSPAPAAPQRSKPRAARAVRPITQRPPTDVRPQSEQPAGSDLAASEGAQAELREMERNLDALLGDVQKADGDAAARRRAADAISHIATRLSSDKDGAGAAAATAPPRALRFLSADYYLRQIAERGMRNRSELVDDFGLDPTYEARMRPFFELMCNKYFRTEVEGIEHVPNNGRALLVCNHSGTLPWDGVMLRTALRLHHSAQRELRWLVEDFVFHAAFLGSFVNRLGAVRACQENAERLLRDEHLVAVFPEGQKGVEKRYAERYKLQRFGRGGYIKLALRTSAPIIPVAVVGAEETYPLLYKVKAFSKALGMPYLPVTPTFPWLGPLGLAPLPSRWRIVFGRPVNEVAQHPESAARDEILVGELNERVRAEVQRLVGEARQSRGRRPFV